MLLDLLKLLQGFLTQAISKWLLAVVGSYLITWGIDNPNDFIYKIIAGLLALLFAWLIDLLQHKKALKTPVK